MPSEVQFTALSYDMEKAVFHLFPALCKGCGLCKEKCPTDVIEWSETLGVYGTPAVKPKDAESCIACLICEQVCPDCAIRIERKKREKKAG
ncbi:MAG: 4Fe-4S binding protein [Syntrophomonadaceae bacterium]|jgi:2-oxoglutarate ferredoxin oxidoreductase subunit delta|nr:4Fe-4S binding protein [Syntrophomonadaceae bacterium]MDH7497527.1 4Fe-4S binding protein [Syntrophomonadaceae bacterium]